MIILWIRRVPKSSVDNKDLCDPKNLAAHNEAMKQFRASHPDMNIIPAQDIMTTDGDLLAPVMGIRLAENSRN